MRLPCGSTQLQLHLDLDPYAAAVRFEPSLYNVYVFAVSDNIQQHGAAMSAGKSNSSSAIGIVTTTWAALNHGPETNDTLLLSFDTLRVWPCQARQHAHLRVHLQLVVAPAAGAGDHLFLRSRLQFTSPNSSAVAEAWWDSVEVISPVLEILTWLDPYNQLVVAGDTLRLAFMVRHHGNSSSAAHDISIVQTADPHLLLIASTLSCGSWCNHQPSANYSIDAAGNQVWRIKALPLGQPFYMQWNVSVQQTAPTGLTLKESFNVTYDSSPRAPWWATRFASSEREDVSGALGPHLYDYRLADIAPALLAVNFFNASIFNGRASAALALPNNTASIVPDELVTWVADIYLPPSTADLSLLVTLPTGLAAHSSQVLTVGAAINNTRVYAGQTDLAVIRGGNRQFDFAFGPAVQSLVSEESSSNLTDQARMITLAFTARVSPSRFTDYLLRDSLATVASLLLFNSQYVERSNQVVYREPRLLVSDPYTRINDAADQPLFGLIVRHDGINSSAAFDVVLTYMFDRRLIYDNGTVVACLSRTVPAWPLTNNSCLLASDGQQVWPVELTEKKITFALDVLSNGDYLTIAAQATVVQDVVPQDVLVNPLTIDFDSSPSPAPYTGRTYALSENFTTLIRSPTVQLSALNSSDPHTDGLVVTVEEDIWVRLTLQLPESVMGNTTVAILSPPDMDLLATSLATVGDSIVGSQLVPGSNFSTELFNFTAAASNGQQQLWFEFGDLLMVANNTADLDDALEVKFTVWADGFVFLILTHFACLICHLL